MNVLARHYKYRGHLSSKERFQQFLQAYLTERKCTSEENKVLNDLLAIIRAFRYDRIENGIALLNAADQDHQFILYTCSLLKK